MTRTELNFKTQESWCTILFWLAICICFTIAAYYLVFCLHHDEHFQVIEFANFKRGLVSADSLAWEYDANLRSALQPLIAYLSLNVLEALELSDPFDQAFALRLLSTVLFIFSTATLCRVLETDLQTITARKLLYISTLFFYVAPIIGVRFSSENLASCFFVLGFTRIYTASKTGDLAALSGKSIVLSGVFLGVSFLLRFQSALLIAGLLLWFFVNHSKPTRFLILLLSGSFLAFAFGTVIDYWFYGKWVLSSWNYLNFNLLEGKSAGFGISPWHFYFEAIDLRNYLKFLNLVLAAATAGFLVMRPRHVLNWIFFPFLIFHCVIAHKETRFLYPILIYIPFFLVYATEKIFKKLHAAKLVLIPIVAVLLLINSFSFIATMLTPRDNSTEIFKYIRLLPNKPIKIIHDHPAFFFTLNNGKKDITPHFYKDKRTMVAEALRITSRDDLRKIKSGADTLTFVILDRTQQENLVPGAPYAFDPVSKLIHSINYRNWMRQGFNSWKLYRIDSIDNYTLTTPPNSP
jgi:phosphatidylinositol glycan class B